MSNRIKYSKIQYNSLLTRIFITWPIDLIPILVAYVIPIRLVVIKEQYTRLYIHYNPFGDNSFEEQKEAVELETAADSLKTEENKVNKTHPYLQQLSLTCPPEMDPHWSQSFLFRSHVFHDGKVWVLFTSGLYCVDIEGDLVWRQVITQLPQIFPEKWAPRIASVIYDNKWYLLIPVLIQHQLHIGWNLYCYIFGSNEWIHLTTTPFHQNFYYRMIALHNQLYLFNSHFCQRYNICTNTWCTLTLSSPLKFHNMSNVVLLPSPLTTHVFETSQKRSSKHPNDPNNPNNTTIPTKNQNSILTIISESSNQHREIYELDLNNLSFKHVANGMLMVDKTLMKPKHPCSLYVTCPFTCRVLTIGLYSWANLTPVITHWTPPSEGIQDTFASYQLPHLDLQLFMDLSTERIHALIAGLL